MITTVRTIYLGHLKTTFVIRPQIKKSRTLYVLKLLISFSVNHFLGLSEWLLLNKVCSDKKYAKASISYIENLLHKFKDFKLV